jgi:hypothetical protein
MRTALPVAVIPSLGACTDSVWEKSREIRGETGKIEEAELSSHLAELPDPCNGWRGTFTAFSALGLTGSSLGHSKDWISIPSSL